MGVDDVLGILGLLVQIAKDFFKLSLKVRVIEVTNDEQKMQVVKFRLDFDNNDFVSIPAKFGR